MSILSIGFKGAKKYGGKILAHWKDRKQTSSLFKQYKQIIKQQQKALCEDSGLSFYIEATSKKIVKNNGFEKETLETLQTTEFVKEFMKMLQSKGYKMPKDIAFVESLLPRKSGLAGQAMGPNIVFNPRSLAGLDFRVIIHELGHSLHAPLRNCIPDEMPFFMKDSVIKHLNKKEREILKADYKRAWQEGFFKHNPIEARIKEGIGTNRLTRQFRKTPEEFYLPNSVSNRFEFVGDYFNLAAQGFEFSPPIAKKYKKYKGPKILKIITKEDLNILEKLRKQILKKTLSDYGVAFKK